MKRRVIFGLVSVVLLLTLAQGANIYLNAAAHPGRQPDSAKASLKIFDDALEKIHQEYVDGDDLTYRQLVYSALKGAVSRLDPHSEFLDPESYQELEDDTEGQFGGVGLMVGLKDGHMTVIAPMDDTPGSRAGILSGDRILKVENQSVEKMDLSDVVKLLRGDAGSQVSLTIERPTTHAVKTFVLTRAIIQMDMVKDINGQKNFPVDANQIGYVRITQFGEDTGEELQAALDRLKQQHLRGLIVDLRWNPGGLLDQAVEVCQKFLPSNQLVVSTEGPRTIEKYYARGSGDELKGIPIVILVNLGSASAAEIVTGCLQDLHRAVVLGEKTFGKGSVQTVFPFDDGSALKLTVAKYYTPSHRVIHEQGITPDVYVPLTDAEEAAVLAKRTPGGLESLPENERASVANTRDEQLDRAEDLLKGLILYNRLTDSPKSRKNG
jgi:carboxyl-terminal processing protease